MLANRPQIIIFLLALVFGLNQQAVAQTSISEDEISIDILKWFYNHYPNAEVGFWTKNESPDGTFYTITFNYLVDQYKTVYSSEGRRVEELKYLKTTPINITNFLHDRFDKFKQRKLALKTTYPEEKISYLVQVKSKSEGLQEIEIDEAILTIINQVAISDN